MPAHPWLTRCLCHQIVSVESPEAALGHLQSSAWGLEGHADAAAELAGKGLQLAEASHSIAYASCSWRPCGGFELTPDDAKVLAGCNSGVQSQGTRGGSSLPASGLRALFMTNQQQHLPGAHLATCSHLCSSCGGALTQLHDYCCAASDMVSRQHHAGLLHEQVPARSLDNAGGPSVHMLMQPDAPLAGVPQVQLCSNEWLCTLQALCRL